MKNEELAQREYEENHSKEKNQHEGGKKHLAFHL